MIVSLCLGSVSKVKTVGLFLIGWDKAHSTCNMFTSGVHDHLSLCFKHATNHGYKFDFIATQHYLYIYINTKQKDIYKTKEFKILVNLTHCSSGDSTINRVVATRLSNQ